jgi:hypothetical protein
MDAGRGFWNADFNAPEIDDTASMASSVFVTTARLSNAVSTGFRMWQLARSLNNLSRKISALLDGIHSSVEQAEKNATPSKKVTKEQIESAIKSFEYLYDVLNRLYSTAQERRLTNNSRMVTSLQNIHRRSEELLDIADWLHAAAHSSASALDSIYAQARKDLAEGNVYDMAQVG